MRPPSGFEAYPRAIDVPVFQTASATWYADSRVSLLCCPPDATVAPSARELRGLVIRARRPIVRYVTPDGVPWGRLVRSERDYSIAALEPKARNQTRRGLERNTVRDVARAELLTSALRLARETWSRQGRRPRHGERGWTLIADAVDAGLARAWGAIGDDGDLGSLAITVDDGRTRHVVFHVSSREGLGRQASNALVFELTRASLAPDGVDLVSFGLRGFVGDSALDHFKVAMGYRVEPTPLRVVMPPGFRIPLLLGVRTPLRATLRAVSADLPGKLETLLALSR